MADTAAHYRWLFTMALSALIGSAAVATLAVVAEEEWEGVLWPLLGTSMVLFGFAIWLFALGLRQRRLARWLPLRYVIDKGDILLTALEIHDSGFPLAAKTRSRLSQWTKDAFAALEGNKAKGTFSGEPEPRRMPSGAGQAQVYMRACLEELRAVLPDG